jgi:hypothetical protein
MKFLTLTDTTEKNLFFFKKKYFRGHCLYFSFSTHKQCHLYTTALLCFPKNLIPLWDSNPGLFVHDADAMNGKEPNVHGAIMDRFI